MGGVAMGDEKTVLNEVASGTYDASDIPFDFVEEGTETALICEPDPQIREMVASAMKSLGYLVTEAQNARDALKKSRFHIYDVVALNERFDTTNPDANDLLSYLGALPMMTRRKMFVILVTDRFRTMDNMTAFNKSVDLVINLKNADDFVTIVKKGLADHRAFYQIFMETLRKIGKA